MALEDGRLYIADVEHHLLRVLDLATRRVTTLAGKTVVGWQDGPLDKALFNEPEGLALDGDDLYVGDTDNHLVRKVALRDGMVSTVAGQLRKAGKNDGSATQAQFHKPMSLAADGAGHVYVADTLNLAVRTLVTRDGSVSTLARLPAVPLGLGVVGADLVVSLANSQIVRIDRASGVVRPWLGAANQEGFVDAANGLDARFVRPAGVCLDGRGNLLVGDSGNQVIRSVSLATGAVSTFAGARSWGAEDGDGERARFHGPRGLIWDGSGNYYVADSGNSTIRKVVLASGQVSTLAGSAGQIGSADGIGEAARFNHPRALALDGSGRLYVADSDAPSIRAVDLATRAVTTIALAPDGGLRLSSPTGLVFTDGALWIADYDAEIIARLDPATGRLSLVAGKPFTLGNSEGVGGVARFNHPESLTSDGRGNLYVTDVYNQSNPQDPHPRRQRQHHRRRAAQRRLRQGAAVQPPDARRGQRHRRSVRVRRGQQRHPPRRARQRAHHDRGRQLERHGRAARTLAGAAGRDLGAGAQRRWASGALLRGHAAPRPLDFRARLARLIR